MFCRNCGVQQGNDDKFCMNCGIAISRNDGMGDVTPVNVNPISINNLPIPEENNSLGLIKIKFPVAALFYIFMILLSIVEFLLIPVWYGASNAPNADMLFFTLGIASTIFLTVILLSKKWGAPLILSICIAAIVPIITSIFQIIVVWGYFDIATIIKFILISIIPMNLPYLLMFFFALYCNNHKGRLKEKVIAKLCYVPGIVVFLLNIIWVWEGLSFVRHFSYMDITHLSMSAIHRLLYNAAVFLLGYWIYYINSVKIAPKITQAINTNSIRSEYKSNAASPAQTYERTGYLRDSSSFGFAVLCFFFPVVGLILYLVWRENLPLRARSCGRGAIAGAIVYVVIVIISVIVQIAAANFILRLIFGNIY
jgi:hypothetical protein